MMMMILIGTRAQPRFKSLGQPESRAKAEKERGRGLERGLGVPILEIIDFSKKT